MRIGHYNLKINYSQQKDLHPLITNILGIAPSDAGNGEWNLYISEKENEYVNFIKIFMGLLDGKYVDLEAIGISRDNITIYVVYEYYGQCNCEFEPQELARLGTNGVALCVSCWENLELDDDSQI